jgi:cell division septal protein FtsQ
MKLKRTAKKNKTTPSKASPKRTLRSPQERRQILIVRTIMCVFIGVVFIGSLVFSYIYLKNVLFVKNQRYVIQFNNKIPNVKDIELVRKLPSTLIVEIKERSPVMRLSRRSNLCVDEDGYIFAVSANKLKFLPYLSGFEYRRVRPGGKLTGRALSAVKLVTVGKSSKLALPISNVNVSPDDYIIVFLSNGKRLDIAWEETYAICCYFEFSQREKI